MQFCVEQVPQRHDPARHSVAPGQVRGIGHCGAGRSPGLRPAAEGIPFCTVARGRRGIGMTQQPEIWTTTAVGQSGVLPGTPAGDAISARQDVLIMSQAAENAVLAPSSPGAWPHALRAALAARIARHHQDIALAEHYTARHSGNPYAALADPACNGADLELAAVVSFFDRVAVRPRDIGAPTSPSCRTPESRMPISCGWSN